MANYANTQFDFPQANETGETSARLPWNNFIYPGNYVAALNAYRDQGVQSIPGVDFFRSVGVYVVKDSDLVSGELPTGDYDLKILSPDKRQDDKPRLDRDLVIRADSGGAATRVYRVAISTVNLTGNSSTITTDPTTLGTAAPTLTSAAESAAGLTDGAFLEGGEFTDFAFDTAITTLTADTTVEATVGVHPLKKVDAKKEAAIIVEVCYFRNAPAPSADDVDLPYPTESGQSEQ